MNNALHFCDLLEDDRSKISMTKVVAWGTAIINFGNIAYQWWHDHPDVAMLVTTAVGHAVGAVKHEVKRRFDK